MKPQARIARLAAIACIRRDADLARLGPVARRRAELRARLDALAELSRAPAPSDPALFAVRQRHLVWAEQQRRALNAELARLTAEWLDLRARAARSYGRVAVLERMRRPKTGAG